MLIRAVKGRKNKEGKKWNSRKIRLLEALWGRKEGKYIKMNENMAVRGCLRKMGRKETEGQGDNGRRTETGVRERRKESKRKIDKARRQDRNDVGK